MKSSIKVLLVVIYTAPQFTLRLGRKESHMYALAVNSKSLILFSIPILLILTGCAPNAAPLPTEAPVQEAPTAVEPTVAATDSPAQ